MFYSNDELFCLPLQEKFTTQHELALLRVSTLMGVVMFGGMSSLFYTQMTGILSVSHDFKSYYLVTNAVFCCN